MKGTTSQLNLRPSPDLKARLQAAADERDLSLDWLCCRLLSEGLDKLVPAGEFRVARDPS